MYEDVPAHLKHQLWTWTAGYLSTGDADGIAKIRAVANHMRYDYARIPKAGSYTKKEQDMRAHIQKRCQDDEDQLRIIEFLLTESHPSSGLHLEGILRLGNSAYSVSADGKRLEMRADPAVRAGVQAVVEVAAGSPGDHLTNAWNEAFGRVPDPVKSYSESIKAVEAALAARVSPQNGKQTLGTMVRDIRAKPGKWKFAIADGNVGGVETVLNMMQLLWDGQTSRHGGVNPTRAETPEEAKAAVLLAAGLVQFGVSGAIAIA